jgi:hypothetical protein
VLFRPRDQNSPDIAYRFCVPDNPSDWPHLLGDITDELLRSKLLSKAGPDAVGGNNLFKKD